MEIIEFDRWTPCVDDSRKVEYVGQRTVEDVFEQLKFRLDGQGYLPDEYFELRDGWKDGREIPREADLFCTVDYGASEGVYVDVYLKWYDEKQKRASPRASSWARPWGRTATIWTGCFSPPPPSPRRFTAITPNTLGT